MFVLAHLSDPHLPPLPTPRFSDLASKRLLGFLNWQRKRRNVHRADALAAIIADIRRQVPDHIAITGDLVNIALPDEFAAARAWLAALGPPKDISLVPGNHDTYVRAMLAEPAARWSGYMAGDAADAAHFPYVRRRGPVALIGLSTAFAAPLFAASGRLGAEQTERVAAVLADLAGAGAFRIVALHHPPVSEPKRHRQRLLDAGPLLDLLAKHGAELVIHGHEHVHSVTWLDGPGHRIPAIGVPSASAANGGPWEPAGYHLYRIDGGPGAWRCEAVLRGLSGETMEVGEIARRVVVRREEA